MRLYGALGLAAVVVVGFQLGTRLGGSPQFERESGAIPLVIDPRALDFGEVWLDRQFTWILPVTNATGSPVHVARLEATCGCSRIEPQTFTVPPGATIPVKVTLDLIRASLPGDQPQKEFHALLTAVLADGESVLRWPLQGVVKNPVVVEPPAIFLGRRSERGEPFEQQLVGIRFLKPIRDVRIVCPPQLAEAVASETTVGSGEYEVVLTPRPPHAIGLGLVQSSLRIRPLSVDDAYLPVVDVPIHADIVRDVEAAPRSLSLGIRRAAEPMDEKIQLHSLTGDDFEVLDAVTSTSEVRIQQDESPASFRVTGNTVGHGLQTIDVSFTIRHADGTIYPVCVPVRYVVADASRSAL